MPVRFLFWNVRGAQQNSWPVRAPLLLKSLAQLAASQQIDVFVIAEYAFIDADLIYTLNGAAAGTYEAVPGRNSRIKLFSRLTNARWIDRFANQLNSRMTAHTLQVGNSRNILFIGFHGHDRRSMPVEADRADMAQSFAADIQLLENDLGHNRTVVCGDFNMNPFEQGMVARRSLHALISGNVAKTIHKLGQRARYPCFYNPMWSCFGDRPNRPPGSYYFSDSLSATNHFWQMLDQVILRPDLLENLTQLAILDNDGNDSLVTKTGRPKKASYSDHLPLFFELLL